MHIYIYIHIYIILSPYLFNIYTEHLKNWSRLRESRNISNLRHVETSSHWQKVAMT